jgi:LysM repeat protein
LSLMLKRGVEALVGAALSLALLAMVLPAVAEAQEGAAATQEARSAKRSADAASVVVRPGDSLWSISEERLGPDATPRQIAGEVERIYALNQNQIGSDPDLIFPGQKFLLPTLGRPLVAEPAIGVARERGATELAQSSPTGRVAKREAAQTSKNPAVGSPTHRAGKAHEAVAVPANLPDAKEAAPVPAASALSGSFAELRATADERKLLGWAIIALTLLVGALMVWKLPMRRNIGDEEVWGIYPGYQGRYAHSRGLGRRGDTSASVPAGSGSDPRTSGAEAHSTNNDTSRVGLRGIAQAKRRSIRRRRVRRLRPFPHKGMATGAHAPEIRSSLLRAAPESQPRMPANVRAKARQQGGGR